MQFPQHLTAFEFFAVEMKCNDLTQQPIGSLQDIGLFESLRRDSAEYAS